MSTISTTRKCIQLLATTCVTACASARQPFRAPAECSRERFALATHYDSASWPSLKGAFRIIEIDTVNQRVPEVDLLRLGPPDSATKAQYTPPFRRLRRGVVELDSTPIRIPVLAGGVRLEAGQPFVPGWVAHENGYISNPCPPSAICFDASPTTYHVTHVSADGFLGEWNNPMIGYARLYDPKKKRELPAPSGYFCAIRRAEDPSAR